MKPIPVHCLILISGATPVLTAFAFREFGTGVFVLLMTFASLWALSGAVRHWKPWWQKGVDCLDHPPLGIFAVQALVIDAVVSTAIFNEAPAMVITITRFLAFLLQLSTSGKMSRDIVPDSSTDEIRRKSPSRPMPGASGK